MGILSYIEEMKSNVRQRKYVAEENNRSKREQELILARARRGMLEDNARVERELAEEKVRIKQLQGPSAFGKLGKIATVGLKELNTAMAESRARKVQLQKVNTKKKKTSYTNEPFPTKNVFEN